MSSTYVWLIKDRVFSASTQAAQTSILNLTSAVEQILQTSQEVSRRVASIETRFVTPSKYPNSALRPVQKKTSTIISLAQDNWDQDTFAQSIRQKRDREEPPPEVLDVASSITPKGQNPSQEQLSSSSVGRQGFRFDPTLESQLCASRVYSRNTHRHSMSSVFSTGKSAAGLSFLSGLSLAQISTLCVVSLPIFCHELWNPQQYQIPQNSGRGASLITEKLSKFRKYRKELLKPPRKAEPTAESTRSEQLYQMLKLDKILLEREIKVVLLGR